MRQWWRNAVVVCLVAVPLDPIRAAEPEAKVLRDSWYESRTDKGKLGHMHLQVREIERDGKTLIHTVIKETFTYRRSGDPYSEKIDHYTIETEKGEVVELGYSSNLSKKQHLELRGPAKGKDLVFQAVVDGKPTPFTERVPWDLEALGLYAVDCLFEGKTPKAGDQLTVKTFHLAANRVVPTHFRIVGKEKTPFGKDTRELTRIEQSFPKEMYLTKSTLWVDADGLIVRMQDDTPLFGLMTYELTTKEKATASFTPRVADIESPIAINKPIRYNDGPPKELVVRVSQEGDDEPGTLFIKDGRQEIVRADKSAVELRLLAKPPPSKIENPPEAPAEYLESNFFIRSDDSLVQKYAKEAIGDETDARQRVARIGKWIQKKVSGNYEIPFATADEVARTLEGDCSEQGVLGAAMCRAVGIPARIAFGIVYDRENPGFGGHLWAEVYLDGQWEPFDPTGILPLVHAAHVKIADYSLKGVLNPDALPEIRRAFSGRMRVELVEKK